MVSPLPPLWHEISKLNNVVRWSMLVVISHYLIRQVDHVIWHYNKHPRAAAAVWRGERKKWELCTLLYSVQCTHIVTTYQLYWGPDYKILFHFHVFVIHVHALALYWDTHFLLTIPHLPSDKLSSWECCYTVSLFLFQIDFPTPLSSVVLLTHTCKK